jgi:hypothetical protein
VGYVRFLIFYGCIRVAIFVWVRHNPAAVGFCIEGKRGSHAGCTFSFLELSS